MTRAVAIGLDGSGWHLLDPMLEAGVMPRLTALVESGARGGLDSTVPPFTPLAWSSAVTGVNPGRHGIHGFFEQHAQRGRPELVHAGKIKAPTIWEIANSQGARAGIYNLPLSYPPQPLEGWMVSGMFTPGRGASLNRFATPETLEKRILEWVPDYLPDLTGEHNKDWRDEKLCRRAIESLEQRYIVLEKLLEEDPVDVVFSVLETPDRLQHAYYRFMDPADAMYESPEGRKLRPWIERCFSAMDRIVGLLVDYAGADGGVVVCSDHGFTGWDTTLHTNVFLEEWGYLKLNVSARAMQTGLPRKLAPLARKFMPKLGHRARAAAKQAAIDWNNTRAYAWPLQGIVVNRKGREPEGIVTEAEFESLLDEISKRFLALEGPDGSPITDRVYRADDLYSGDFREGAPDLFPVLRDRRVDMDQELFTRRKFTDRSDLPRGVHHPEGIVLVAGPGVRAGGRVSGTVMDVTPTLLYLAGLKVPTGLDGGVLAEAFVPEAMAQRPPENTDSLETSRRDAESPYSQEEEAMIEESLRGLGYL